MKDRRNLHTDAKYLGEQVLKTADSVDDSFVFDNKKDQSLQNVYHRLVNGKSLTEGISNYSKYSSKEGFSRFIRAIDQYPHKVKYNLTRTLLKYGAAASIIMLLGVFTYLYMLNSENHQPQIGPGMARSTMVLSDGNILTASSKKFTYANNDIHIKYDKGSFVYPSNNKLDSLLENKLYVPRGGEAKVVLSDGTTVWLNADSYLKHPVAFVGNTREVFLEGEAYFEVTTDKEHPFIVHMQKGDVAVYGTGFGITAYPEEPSYITLDHGKISFKAKDKEELFLNPGEQIIADGSSVTKLSEVNVREFTGWKDGLFMFNNKRLEDIMNILERWYDVNVAYKDPSLKEIRFNGDLKRYDSINVLLEALYLTKELGYSIEGRTITLYQK